MNEYSFDRKVRALETIYRWYDDIAWSLNPWACERGCATCCTSLVISTTLEAAYLQEHSRLPGEKHAAIDSIDASLPALTMTTNERASLCIEKKNFAEDTVSPTGLPCPFLEDRHCSCYEARPLMCRMMFSSARCDGTGQAEMPSLLLSLNTVCLQLVEHLDQKGWSGYLLHLLPRFRHAAFTEAYKAGSAQADDVRIRQNRPNPGYLVPPEDQGHIQSWLQELHNQLRNL